MKIDIPEDHPRHQSLLMRERVIEGYERSVVAAAGLIAHGRGEAFDYLIGEKTQEFAEKSVAAAACAFVLAERPVVSVNGNVAALCPSELVELSQVSGAPLEINLFYRTDERERAIEEALRSAGAGEVLGVGLDASAVIPELGSERRRVDPRGIAAADLVFVPLEDGDRTEALIAQGKEVVTVDLNPLSRTAQRASITVVDNILRTLPALIGEIRRWSSLPRSEARRTLEGFDNRSNLSSCLAFISDRLNTLARS